MATGLSAHYAQSGQNVLHVGCDPKRDSSLRLIGKMPSKVVVDFVGLDSGAVAAHSLINEGRNGVHCIESGGPEPGLGCGGRGVARTIEIMDEIELLDGDAYEVVVFDVLGDVVCGGFAAPLRKGFAEKVVIVVSEEPMALFAANNIAKAVVTYASNGVVLAGLVANLKTSDESHLIRLFAEHIDTKILATLPRDRNIIEAERRCQTVLDYAPESAGAMALQTLAKALSDVSTELVTTPKPLGDEAFFELVR